ncbi:MAG: hypothetical protein ACXAAT_00915 [Candidatus Hodarchaeales archaeon]
MMRSKVKGKLLFLIFTILLGLVLLFSMIPIRAHQQISKHINSEETFNIDNTNSTQRLFQKWPEYIGSTWNVSIFLSPNSTSGVKFVFGTNFGYYYSYWEGPKEFEVHPNETYNAIYVQHYESDAVVDWWMDYSLLEPTKNASGEYAIQKTNAGYLANVGTGETYIENITAWLLSQSKSMTTSSTTIPSTHTSPSIGLATILVGATIVISRRVRKR